MGIAGFVPGTIFTVVEPAAYTLLSGPFAVTLTVQGPVGTVKETVPLPFMSRDTGPPLLGFTVIVCVSIKGLTPGGSQTFLEIPSFILTVKIPAFLSSSPEPGFEQPASSREQIKKPKKVLAGIFINKDSL
jgi:hypothetical protein